MRRSSRVPPKAILSSASHPRQDVPPVLALAESDRIQAAGIPMLVAARPWLLFAAAKKS